MNWLWCINFESFHTEIEKIHPHFLSHIWNPWVILHLELGMIIIFSHSFLLCVRGLFWALFKPAIQIKVFDLVTSKSYISKLYYLTPFFYCRFEILEVSLLYGVFCKWFESFIFIFRPGCCQFEFLLVKKLKIGKSIIRKKYRKSSIGNRL